MPEITIADEDFAEAIQEVLNDNPSLIDERINEESIAECIIDGNTFSRAVDGRVDYHMENYNTTPDFGSWIIEQYHGLPDDVASWCSLGEAVRGIVAAVVTAMLDGTLDGVYPQLDEALQHYRNADIKLTVDDYRTNGDGDAWSIVLCDSYGAPYNVVGPFADYNSAAAYQTSQVPNNSRLYCATKPLA